MEQRLDTRTMGSIAVLVFLLLVAVWYFVGLFQNSKGAYEYELDEGWDTYVNGELTNENAVLSEVNFGELKAGAILDLYVELPDELNEGYMMEVLLYLCSVEAYVGDEKVYDYASDQIDKNVMIGSGNHFIPIPPKSSGQTLHLRMVMNEDDAYASIATPKCTRIENAYLAFSRSQMINSLIGIFLLMLGMILFIVSLAATIFNKAYYRLILIGWFSVNMGAWTILVNKVAQLYNNEFLRNTNFEYIALFFAPIPFALLIYDIRKEDSTWRKVVLRVVCIALILFAVVSTVLHYSNIYRYPRSLTWFHIIGIIAIICIAVAGFFSVKQRSNSEFIMALGMVVLLVFLGMDLFRFNIQKYFLPNNDVILNSFIPIGMLAFVVFLLVSYIIYLYDMIMTKAERETLVKLAYNDGLTGLFNRARYQEVMTELDAQTEDYALISFDLNNLKTVNDSLGHIKGDMLIRTFSDVLKSNFDAIGTCFRTGGDEFTVVVQKGNLAVIDDAIKEFEADEQKAAKEIGMTVFAAYGVAYSREIPGEPAFKVFKLADRRMYDMKVRTKGEDAR